MTKRKRS